MNKYECPIAHLSFSSLQEYCSDRQKWFRHYVKKIWNDKKSVAQLEGEGVHWCIEHLLTKQYDNQHNAVAAFMNIVDERDATEEIAWKKDDKEKQREALEKTITQTLEWAMEYIHATVGEIEAIEPTYMTKVGDAPIILKSKLDCVTTNNVVYDWKCVTTFGDAMYIKPSYILQAMAYAIARGSIHGQLPERVVFVEIKKTKNRPKKGEELKPQVQEIVIPVTPEYIKVFTELYSRVCDELQGKALILEGKYIPNPFAFFGWEDGWRDFTQEVLGVDMVTGEMAQEQEITLPF